MDIIIVANAPTFDATPFIPRLRAADYVIAADGGANALYQLKYIPQQLIGDLDSVAPPVLAWLEAHACQITRFPREKNETDLELALLAACRYAPQSIDILGATGGRLDHTLANIGLLTLEELHGCAVRLLDHHQELLMVRAGESYEVSGNVGDTVSLLPWNGPAHGITLEGFYYPLADATLLPNRARGISNILQQSPARIIVRDGFLLMVHHFDAGEHQWCFYRPDP